LTKENSTVTIDYICGKRMTVGKVRDIFKDRYTFQQ
jgi:hypothetical protein